MCGKETDRQLTMRGKETDRQLTMRVKETERPLAMHWKETDRPKSSTFYHLSNIVHRPRRYSYTFPLKTRKGLLFGIRLLLTNGKDDAGFEGTECFLLSRHLEWSFQVFTFTSKHNQMHVLITVYTNKIKHL